MPDSGSYDRLDVPALNDARPEGGAGALPGDPLAAALVFMTRYFGRPQPHMALVAGLPLVDGRLSLDVLDAAASRARLSVEVVQTDPGRLDDLSLPAIVWLKDDGLRVVVERVGRGGRAKFVLADPTREDATTLMKARELSKRSTRDVVLVRPAFDFDRPARLVDTAGRGDWFWSAFRQNFGIFGQIALGTIVINLLALALPLFMMNVYDRVVPNNAIETLWALGIGVGVAAILDFILRGARAYMIDVASRRSDVVLANRIFQRLLGVRLGAQRIASGARANMLREYETVREFFNSFTVATLGDMPFILLFILVVWLIAPGVAIVPTVTVPIVLVLALLAQLPLSRIVKRSFNDQSNKNGVLFESLGGLETIKGIGAEGWSSARWERAVASSIRSSVSARIVASFSQNLIILAQLVSTVALVAVGVFAIQEGTLTAGGLIAAVILNSRALAPLMQIANMLTRMHQARVAFKALNELMSLPVERRGAGSYVHKPNFDGAIKVENLSFAYPGTGQRVLDDVSFAIRPGERVGVGGGIGSGKSTLLRLLLQLYEPEGGHILYDGTDARNIDPAVLRGSIGYAPQTGDVFTGTIRENIAMGAPYVDDAAIERAAALSGAAEWIGRLPSGLDTEVGERGCNLSGGQRQSVALTRAFLREPPILFLDEPTSELDGGLEALFLKRLRLALPGRTLVMVAHRSAALAVVDRLIVVQNGKIAMDGPKDKVLAELQKLRQGPVPSGAEARTAATISGVASSGKEAIGEAATATMPATPSVATPGVATPTGATKRPEDVGSAPRRAAQAATTLTRRRKDDA